MNLFKTLKELDITAWEFMEAPYYLSDSGKILFILTFRALECADCSNIIDYIFERIGIIGVKQ